MHSEIFNKLRTSEEQLELGNLLDLLEKNLYLTHPLQQKEIKEKEIFANLLEENLNLSKINELRQKLKEFRYIKMIVPCEPNDNLTDKLSTFVKTTIGENVLIDFEVDESIISGVVYVWEGKYHDYSCKNKIEEFVNNYHA